MLNSGLLTWPRWSKPHKSDRTTDAQLHSLTTEPPTQLKSTGGAPTTLPPLKLSPLSKIKDLAVLAGVSVVLPLLNPPCAWTDNKIAAAGPELPNSSWSIAAVKITPLWDHTTIWLVTVVGSTTLCTTPKLLATLMATTTTHTSLDPPNKPETASLLLTTL